MTYERALKELKRQVQYWKNGIPFAYKLQPLEFAVSALEKQIPKKPKAYPLSDGQCPSCNAVFDYDWKPKSKYCQNCGQALDWSDNE